MNVYRALGDGSHYVAIAFLLSVILYSKSCKGFSGKTQILYLTVFVSRYFDLFLNFVSIYNSVTKAIFILSKSLIVFLMYGKFRDTRQKEHDTFRIEILLILCGILAFFFKYDNSVVEFFWAFSIYLESVCIIPQLYMIKKMGTLSAEQLVYLSFLGAYRGLYIFNWKYRYETEGFYDTIPIVAGCVQTSIFAFTLFIALFNQHWYGQVKQSIDLICQRISPCVTRKDITTNSVDECWLIDEKGQKQEEESSNLSKVIHKLNINLEPGADLGFTKSKK